MNQQGREAIREAIEEARTEEEFRAIADRLESLPDTDQDRWDLGEQLGMTSLIYGIDLDTEQEETPA